MAVVVQDTHEVVLQPIPTGDGRALLVHGHLYTVTAHLRREEGRWTVAAIDGFTRESPGSAFSLAFPARVRRLIAEDLPRAVGAWAESAERAGVFATAATIAKEVAYNLAVLDLERASSDFTAGAARVRALIRTVRELAVEAGLPAPPPPQHRPSPGRITLDDALSNRRIAKERIEALTAEIVAAWRLSRPRRRTGCVPRAASTTVEEEALAWAARALPGTSPATLAKRHELSRQLGAHEVWDGIVRSLCPHAPHRDHPAGCAVCDTP